MTTGGLGVKSPALMVHLAEYFVKEGICMKILIFIAIYVIVYVIIRGTIRAIFKK